VRAIGLVNHRRDTCPDLLLNIQWIFSFYFGCIPCAGGVHVVRRGVHHLRRRGAWYAPLVSELSTGRTLLRLWSRPCNVEKDLQLESQAVGTTGMRFAYDRAAPGELTKVQLHRPPRQTRVLAKLTDRRPTSAIVIGTRSKREQDQLGSGLKRKLAHELDVLPCHGDACHDRRGRSDGYTDSR
jgi:hypothetical protein